MTFGGTLKDSSGQIPISQGYLPDDGFRASASSRMKFTDGQTNISAGVVTADQIKEAIMNGQGYSATTDSVSNAGNSATAGFSIFNGSGSGKSIFIYSLTFFDNAFNGSHLLKIVTSNPALATTITPRNRKAGGAASAIATTVTFLNTGYTPTGTTIDIFACSDTGMNDFLQDKGILLPQGSNNGLVLAPFFFATQTHFFGVTAHWIEF